MAKRSISEPEPTQDDTGSATAVLDDANEIASRPEMVEAFDRVFGPIGDGSARRGPTARDRRMESQELDELEGGDPERDGLGEDETLDGKGLKDTDSLPTDGDSDDGKDAQAPKKDDAEAVTLSAVLRHAAKRAGMEDGEIEAFYKENPEIAERTFQRLYQSYNNLTNEYAKLGQGENAPLPGRDDEVHPPARRPVPPSGNVLEQIYGSEQLADFEQDYGKGFNEKVLAPLLGHFNDTFGSAKQYYEEQQDIQLSMLVDNYFSGLEKPFQSLYGSGKNVDATQRKNRIDCADLADQIVAGAAKRGMRMPVEEALERANLSYSSPHMQELERKRITQQVKERSRQISHRPRQRRTPESSGGPVRSDQAAIDAVAKRGQELGFYN
jgi:hypothetical protein